MQLANPDRGTHSYAYDTGGSRSLQRTTSGGITQLTVYAFGIDEYHYDGSGNLQNSTHYYTLGGSLLAELSGPPNAETTNFFLTDALGSVLATFSNTAGAATMLGTQLFGPYARSRFITISSAGMPAVPGCSMEKEAAQLAKLTAWRGSPWVCRW
jgi:hypothetical protein